MDESLVKRFSVTGKNKHWYPFIYDPKEVQLFETEFQKLAANRQELKDKILKAIKKSQEGNDKKKSKKTKKDKEEMEMEGGEGEGDGDGDGKKDQNEEGLNEEEKKEKEKSKEKRKEKRKKEGKEEEEEEEAQKLVMKIKNFIGTQEDVPQEICEAVKQKLDEITEDIKFDYKTTINGNLSTRTCCITKECTKEIFLMSDEEINAKIALGYTCPKDRLNKKRDFRRINNYKDFGYNSDPVNGVRLAINLSSKASQNPKASQNKKKTKSKKTNNKDVLSLGSQKTFDPESEFKEKLTYTYKLSDKEKIDECIEELKSNKDYQIKTDTYLADFLSEDLCVEKLQKLFEMKVEDDKTAINVSNPWIQIVLGILIMTKDFINFNDNFSLESKKKNEEIQRLFDPYWNFSPKENIFSIDSDCSEFTEVLFGTKHESEMQRVQSFCMNLCFRGLAYYYFKNGVDYTIDRVMIHFEGKKTDKAQAIAEIEDMSYLMIALAQFEIEEYNKKALKKKNNGVLLILDRITFADPSFYFIPAMLPMYIVNIKEGESDESEGSDEEQSEDSDNKNKKAKKSKKNKKDQSSKSKKKKRKDDDDDDEEVIETKKNKKSKNKK